jgi:hypothetical protein
MPQFPRTKEEIMVLATRTMTGINDNPTIFPNPPYDSATLGAALLTAMNKMAVRQAKEAELRDAVAEETDAIHEVAELERHLLRVAEDQYEKDPGKLELLGWGAEADPRRLPPGQPRNLEVRAQGPATAYLDWKAPIKSQSVGSVRFYRIERMIRDTQTNKITEEWGQWQATTSDAHITLHDQPRRVEIMYRVVANNPNGDGPHSDTETVVL